MKLSPMIIQGLWEFKSTFLQLPFVTDDHLRMFTSKKRHVKNLQQFAQLKPDESRHILKHLSDFEYEQVIRALGKMPLIDFSIRCEGMCVCLTVCRPNMNIDGQEHAQLFLFLSSPCVRCTVIDDENTNVVTAGAIVTVTVTLVRNYMSELFGNADVAEKQGIK